MPLTKAERRAAEAAAKKNADTHPAAPAAPAAPAKPAQPTIDWEQVAQHLRQATGEAHIPVEKKPDGTFRTEAQQVEFETAQAAREGAKNLHNQGPAEIDKIKHALVGGSFEELKAFHLQYDKEHHLGGPSHDTPAPGKGKGRPGHG